MFSPRSLALLATALCATLSLTPNLQVAAAPAPAPAPQETAPATSDYWLGSIERQGTVWGNDDSYKVFRNVQDYGAMGDGLKDDTEAINFAISDGGRCGDKCNSTTIQPAIVYFPSGTYLVSKPIVMYYYTQMIGDATNKPVIKALPEFEGIGVLDSDPYIPGGNGAGWYINQNNFFRQVRNFVLDLTGNMNNKDMNLTGIHWQVAQATSLQNIDFKMTEGGNQQGLFMDNGSGGWMSDLTFEGGQLGALFGSQQFTSRNLNFINCQTAIHMNWNWGWVLSNISISGGKVGINMANNASNETVGSVVFSDSKISGTTYGIRTSFSKTENIPANSNSLIIDNVDMSGVTESAVWSVKDSASVLAPGKITAWAQGNIYDNSATANRSQGAIAQPSRSSKLLDSQGNIFGRSKPQYENVAVKNFKSAKSAGCKGDGVTDDTACIQQFLNDVSNTTGAIAYFDHGAYIIKDTIIIPNSIKITGEIWPLIVADGASFNDATNPKPVFQVGQRDSTAQGAVEITELMFETKGAAPGAIMIEWNLNSDAGSSGMWDSHVRIGGSYGTELSEAQCPGWPTTTPTDQCHGVFLMFHARPNSGGIYLENTWFWVADHDLEVNNQTQISIFSARGTLIQSQGPVWLWGTASEHSVMYNYQFDGAQAVFGGFMQTETPYFQPNPEALQPFAINSAYDDPTFTVCANGGGVPGVPCEAAWGMRIVNSKSILIYSLGMYSFFNNYSQACVQAGAKNCQEYMIRIQDSQVSMYAVTTIAAVKMIMDDALPAPILGADNRAVFGDTIALYKSG